MKYKYTIILWFLSIAFLVSCNKEETFTKYQAIPKTPTGTKLVENTDLFASVFSDSTYAITDGAKVTEIYWLSMEGLAMHTFIFEIDLTNPNISIEVSTPFNKSAFGRQKMTEQALYEDADDHRVWGGVNGDFFNLTTGVPQGIIYKDGKSIKTTFQDAVCTYFAITKDKKAIIAGQDVFDEIKSTFKEAVGGRAMLLQEGVILPQTSDATEPRTCIGVSANQDIVYIMVIDGRNWSYSNGMNYTELAQCMKALGAENAINLDGGGSSTFFVRNTPEFSDDRFELLNWPSDNGGEEREVADGILIISNN